MSQAPLGRVSAVCVVHALLPEPTNPGGVTAIDKRAVPERVPVATAGLAGDTQCDVRHHGGPDQAVYAYAEEDAQRWAAELGRPIPAGMFGENLRVTGIDVSGAEIGETWTIGDDGLVLEVVSARIPCATFQRRMGEERWVRRFTDGGAPGAYLRVVHQGSVGAQDPVRVTRPGHGVSVADTFLGADPEPLRRLLQAEATGLVRLVDRLREQAEKTIARADVAQPAGDPPGLAQPAGNQPAGD